MFDMIEVCFALSVTESKKVSVQVLGRGIGSKSFFPKRVSLVKVRTLVIGFELPQIGSILLPVQFLSSGALALSGEKRLISGFLKVSSLIK